MSLFTRTVGGSCEVDWLGAPIEPDPERIGAKAANLAIAAANGLPVLAGFAVPVERAADVADDPGLVHASWRRLTADGAETVVVRSSSPSEDTAASSMAGVFASVVDVSDWEAFGEAVRRVVGSAGGAPMAVLVQRQLDASMGGVLFGVDPATGRADRVVVAAVEGPPWQLVSGAVDGRRTVLTRRGRVVLADGDLAPVLTFRQRRLLLRFERELRRRFGGPQDVEWAIDRNGRFWLLQSRPVTAVAEVAQGPRFGTGPVAETFPEPMSRLEEDLWLAPLGNAIAHVLALVGAASPRRIAASPIVRTVSGRAVADLDLIEGRPRGVVALLDPRPRLRQLAASWRLGRIRAAFPTLVRDVLDRVDGALERVPPLDELADPDLVTLLESVRAHLIAVHGHELLAARVGGDGASGSELALRALRAGRAEGLTDDEIVTRRPAVLSLLPPRIGDRPPLPPLPSTRGPSSDRIELSDREALRLRIRWLHELSSLAALELGRRFAARHLLPEAGRVDGLSLDELRRTTAGDLGPVELPERSTTSVPVPAVFRLSRSGAVLAEASVGGAADGVGAAGGRATGTVSHRDPRPGQVLVLDHLDPSYAAMLPDLGGLVAETGSPLSHLAILAREYGVPTVVGFTDARRRLRPGARVVIDGSAGTVEIDATGEEVG